MFDVASSGPRAPRAALWLAIGLAVASCLPVLVARYPQMSDYPAHLARYRVMLDGGRDPVLARYYGFAWQWTGNVGVDLLIRPFAATFGLEGGGRVIAGLIPPLTGLGLVAVAWVLRRRIGVGVFLALAFVWSPMMLIGLLNFALGQAAALWAFALWVVMARRPGVRAAVFVAVGVVVWLCHLSAWGMLGILVFGWEWSRAKSWHPFLAPWPLLGPLAIMAAVPGTAGTFSYGAYWWIYKQAIWIKAMRDTSYSLDLLGEVAVIGAILVALAARRIDGRLGWAAAMMMALSLALPRHISGGDYADYRMVTSGLMIGCLAIDWRPTAWAGRWLVPAAAVALDVARLAVTTATWAADSAETARQLAALDALPRGARVASAVLIPGGVWGLDRFEHIGAYALIRRDALVNANFAVPHVHMLRLKVPFYVDPSHRVMQPLAKPVDLSDFRPATDLRVGAQYLWYVGPKAPAKLPAGARVIWQQPGGLLAQLAPAAAGPASGGPADAPPLAKRRVSH